MSDILKDLGIDPDELNWEQFAGCKNMDRDLFFDLSEDDDADKMTYSDPVVAAAVDQICLSCPVINDCLEVGISEKRWGVWGGVYLTDGSISAKINGHKTEEDWDAWRGATGESGR